MWNEWFWYSKTKTQRANTQIKMGFELTMSSFQSYALQNKLNTHSSLTSIQTCKPGNFK